MIFVFVNMLLVDVFDFEEVGIVSGFVGMVVWIGGFGFLLLVGVFVDKIGYVLLFVCFGLFDIIGVMLFVVLICG